jgi:hypothetical protein
MCGRACAMKLVSGVISLLKVFGLNFEVLKFTPIGDWTPPSSGKIQEKGKERVQYMSALSILSCRTVQ